MKIWFDTEFIENGKTIDLLSIGMIKENGDKLYLENNEADLSKGSDWVQHNVIISLNWLQYGKSRDYIAKEIKEFAGSEPEFWAYYADYDWVVLCQLFGTMMDLPEGWPMYCRDVKQFCDSIGNPKLPMQISTEHHALADAIWTKQTWEFLIKCPH